MLTSKLELRLLLHTKIVELTILVGSPWLLCWVYESTLGRKDWKWMKHRDETYSDIFKRKHIWTGENAINCSNGNKILCMARQVIQSANCALARQLKNVLVYLTWKLLCTKIVNEKQNQPWMRNKLGYSTEHLICYPPCQWIIQK